MAAVASTLKKIHLKSCLIDFLGYNINGVLESFGTKNFSRISGVPLETVLDSGSTRIVLTNGTLVHLQKCLRNQGTPKSRVKTVQAYDVTLTEYTAIRNTTRLLANVELCAPEASINIGSPMCTLLPGPLVTVLIGHGVLGTLGLKPPWAYATEILRTKIKQLDAQKDANCIPPHFGSRHILHTKDTIHLSAVMMTRGHQENGKPFFSWTNKIFKESESPMATIETRIPIRTKATICDGISDEEDSK